MARKPIGVMNTAFRDGFQSCLGARVFWKDYRPAVEAAAAAGVRHFEFGGGAMFQSAFFYCGTSAFDVMDCVREVVGPDVTLQTLARGINVVGLDSQPSDVIDLHARLFRAHGTTVIRNFDALNDVSNLVFSGQCIHRAGLRHEVAITMMALPPGCTGAHDPAFYLGTLEAILDSGVPFDSLCFKDASGTTTPQVVYDTILAARRRLGPDVPIRMHTHETAGTSVLVYRAALDAGADGLDLSMAPMSGGTCQPDIITLWHALRGTDYDLGLDIDKIVEAEAVFKACMAPYDLLPEDRLVEPLIPWSPMPGGALTANTQMLRDNGILDKYPAIIQAMTETVRRGGFGTSVTPVSQFYFQQAFNNVMFGPWEKIADGYGRMVLGYFGRPPSPPDPEIVRICSEKLNLSPTTEDPRTLDDQNPAKGLVAARKALEAVGLSDPSDEDLFIAATCGPKGIAFLQGERPIGVRLKQPAALASPAKAPQAAQAPFRDPRTWRVDVSGHAFDVSIDGDSATVNGHRYTIGVAPASGDDPLPSPAGGTPTPVPSPLPGTVIKVLVEGGQRVAAGAVLVIIEAMKMQTEVRAKEPGTISRVLVRPGEQIRAGQPIVAMATQEEPRCTPCSTV